MVLFLGYGAVTHTVHASDHVGQVLSAHVVASALDKPLQFIARDASILVDVKRAKGQLAVYILHIDLLSQRFVGALGLEVTAPHGAELDLSVLQEAIVLAASGDVALRIGTSLDKQLPVVIVERCKRLAELSEREPVIAGPIVARHKQVELFDGRVHADGVQTCLQIMHGQLANLGHVKYSERIEQVEVTLLSQRNFARFQLLLDAALLPHLSDHLVLFFSRQHKLLVSCELRSPHVWLG